MSSTSGPPPIPREDLLDEIRRLADDLGRTPTKRDMNDLGAYSGRLYFDRFDSWNAAVEEAGLEPNPQRARGPSDEELLAELRRLASELGRSPSSREMRRYGTHSDSTYVRRFGSWDNALSEVDLTPRHSGLNPEQQRIIQQLQETG